MTLVVDRLRTPVAQVDLRRQRLQHPCGSGVHEVTMIGDVGNPTQAPDLVCHGMPPLKWIEVLFVSLALGGLKAEWLLGYSSYTIDTSACASTLRIIHSLGKQVAYLRSVVYLAEGKFERVPAIAAELVRLNDRSIIGVDARLIGQFCFSF